jgi:hypothetical protein
MRKENCKDKKTTDNNTIVSFRASIEEKMMIEKWAKKNNLNTSSVLRAMIHYLQGSADDVFKQYKTSEKVISSR